MNNYTNNEPQDPHGFKEQVKINYKATKAIAQMGQPPWWNYSVMHIRKH